MTQPENCRHEYVRIFQRGLKGLERRLISRKAWLPVGFKDTDFPHLSEGSYCFCTTCRKRLFPRRTAAEKAEARLALQRSKAEAAAQALEQAQDLDATNDGMEYQADESAGDSMEDNSDDAVGGKKVSVEELEVDALGIEEIGDSGVDMSDDEESV